MKRKNHIVKKNLVPCVESNVLMIKAIRKIPKVSILLSLKGLVEEFKAHFE